MDIPILAGKSFHIWLGIILILLLMFQVSTGKRWIKLPFVYHRRNAMLIFLIAMIHIIFDLCRF